MEVEVEVAVKRKSGCRAALSTMERVELHWNPRQPPRSACFGGGGGAAAPALLESISMFYFLFFRAPRFAAAGRRSSVA